MRLVFKSVCLCTLGQFSSSEQLFGNCQVKRNVLHSVNFKLQTIHLIICHVRIFQFVNYLRNIYQNFMRRNDFLYYRWRSVSLLSLLKNQVPLAETLRITKRTIHWKFILLQNFYVFELCIVADWSSLLSFLASLNMELRHVKLDDILFCCMWNPRQQTKFNPIHPFITVLIWCPSQIIWK